MAGFAPSRNNRGTKPRRNVTALVALTVGGAVALAIGVIVLALLSRPAREVDKAVGRLLSPPPPRGVTEAEIVLGMAAPFTGANRELGRAIRTGVEAALEDANAAGGVHGRRVRLVALDDGYEPSRTGPVMKQLVEDEGVFAVVGNVGTPTAAVAIPYCMERKVVFLGALSGGDLLRRQPPDRYVFNFRPSYAEETAAAVRYLVDIRRVAPHRIAVFAQEDEFGSSGWRGVAEELSRRGVNASAVVRTGYRRNTASVDGALAILRRRAADVDAVVMVATYKAAATFIRGLRDAGLRLLTTNVSAVDANSLAEELSLSGREYTEGVVVTQVVPLPTSPAPGVARFRGAMARHGRGEEPGFLSLEGWVVANILLEGLRRAGPELDSEKLVEALEGIRDLDLGIGATVSFTPLDHQGSRTVWVTALQKDGRWRQLD